MDAKKYVLTTEGFEKKEAELKERKTTKRSEIVELIKEARAQGDLSENAEYDSAKDEQAKNESEIKKLEEILGHAEVIDETKADNETVSFGKVVKVFDEEFEEEIVYRIVGSVEADPLNDKISIESPAGAALMGAKVNDKVTVTTESGEIVFKVLEIDNYSK